MTRSNVEQPWPESNHGLVVELDPDVAGERALVHVAGQLDISTAPILVSELFDLAGRQHRHIDLDLLHLTFCDGSGLAALLEGRRRITQHGGAVTLHDPCTSLRRILDIYDLTLDLEPRVPPRSGVPLPVNQLAMLPPAQRTD